MGEKGEPGDVMPEPVRVYTQWVYGDGVRHLVFGCAACGRHDLDLKRRSSAVEMSGIFCRGCGEQYWTRWDGMVWRGRIDGTQREKKEDVVNDER